jgi:hypothetical protein
MLDVQIDRGVAGWMIRSKLPSKSIDLFFSLAQFALQALNFGFGRTIWTIICASKDAHISFPSSPFTSFSLHPQPELDEGGWPPGAAKPSSIALGRLLDQLPDPVLLEQLDDRPRRGFPFRICRPRLIHTNPRQWRPVANRLCIARDHPTALRAASSISKREFPLRGATFNNGSIPQSGELFFNQISGGRP